MNEEKIVVVKSYIPPEVIEHLFYIALIDCDPLYDYETRQQMIQKSKERMIEHYITRSQEGNVL